MAKGKTFEPGQEVEVWRRPLCLGVGRIRDGETNELRKCLDCNGTGLAARRTADQGKG